MKELIVMFVLNHAWHVLSIVGYSIIEYKIGKNKDIQGNSLLEVIENNIWSKK